VSFPPTHPDSEGFAIYSAIVSHVWTFNDARPPLSPVMNAFADSPGLLAVGPLNGEDALGPRRGCHPHFLYFPRLYLDAAYSLIFQLRLSAQSFPHFA